MISRDFIVANAFKAGGISGESALEVARHTFVEQQLQA